MKLEVGQFVRLTSGYCDELGIGKIDFVANCGVTTIDFKNEKLGMFVEDIKKASFNIIDLVEEGDYVNGDKVNEIVINEFSSYVILEGIGHYVEDLETVEAKDIETIVTKEQFEQMAYKVGK